MNFKRFGATALALMLVMSTFGMAFVGGAAAATTTTESDLTDAETTEDEIADNVIVDFEASDEDTTTVIVETEQTFDADALDDADVTLEDWDTLALNVSHDGTEHSETVAVDEDDADISLTDTTGEVPAEATFEIDHDDLETLPGDAGAGTIVDVTVTEAFEDADHADADDEDMVEIETAFVAEFEFASDYAAVTFDDDAAETEDVEHGFFSLNTIPLLGDDDDEPADIHTFEETVGINGANTTVTVNDDTTDGADAFDDALEAHDSDLVLGAAAAADGELIYAFDGEADEDVVDTDEDTYAVYEGDGTWTFHVGDDHADEDELEVFVSSQNALDADFDSDDVADLFVEDADLSYSDLTDGFDTLDVMFGLGVLPFIGMAVPTAALAGLFVVSRRRRRTAA